VAPGEASQVLEAWGRCAHDWSGALELSWVSWLQPYAIYLKNDHLRVAGFMMLNVPERQFLLSIARIGG